MLSYESDSDSCNAGEESDCEIEHKRETLTYLNGCKEELCVLHANVDGFKTNGVKIEAIIQLMAKQNRATPVLAVLN